METIGIVSTVRAPFSQLKAFVNFHLNIGIDCIVLFFDDPDDEAFKKFQYYPKVITICCDKVYWKENGGERPLAIEERQKININKGIEYLGEKGCSWSIHIDSDELVNPLKPIKSLLSENKADIVRFTVLEAVAEKEEYENIFLPSLFRKQSRKEIVKLASKTGFFKAFFDGEFFRGHTASKAAVRIKPEFNNLYSIHGVDRTVAASQEITKFIQLLHYDCVSLDDWRTKWDRRLDGSGIAVGMRSNRQRQMEFYKKAKDKNDNSLSELFNRLHNVRRRERPFLYVFNMLTRVNLDTNLFDDASS